MDHILHPELWHGWQWRRAKRDQSRSGRRGSRVLGLEFDCHVAGVVQERGGDQSRTSPGEFAFRGKATAAPLTAGQGSCFIQAPRTPRAADTERFVPEFFPFTGEPPGTPSLGELGGLQFVPVPAARGRSKHGLGEHEEVAPGLQGIGSGNLAKGSSKALGPGRASSLGDMAKHRDALGKDCVQVRAAG